MFKELLRSFQFEKNCICFALLFVSLLSAKMKYTVRIRNYLGTFSIQFDHQMLKNKELLGLGPDLGSVKKSRYYIMCVKNCTAYIAFTRERGWSKVNLALRNK